MNKSTWKNAVVLGMAAMMLASPAFAAKKKKSSGDPYKKVTKQKDPATKKVWDFGGMEVIIGDWWTDPSAPAASKQQEDTFAFRKWTNETYNMNVTQKAVSGWGSNPQFVSDFCIAGGNENYVLIIDTRSATTGVKANLFYDLSKIKSVDYKNAKYDQGVVELLKKGNSFYGFNWGKPEPRNGIFFNKRILQENGYDPDYPYDLQKKDKWTWETFEDMCKKLTKDTNNDGIIDQYAMASFNTEFSYAALDSNNAKIIDRDKNGKYINVAGSQNAMETWNWIQHMFTTYQQPQPEGGNWDYFYNSFINGEVAFLADQEYNAQPGNKLSNMADDYGFVCFPHGPHGDGIYRTQHQSNICIIPAIYDSARAEKIAKAVDLWIEPTPGYDGPNDWMEGYYASFRDSRAVEETLALMMQYPNPRYDVLIAGLNQGDIIWPLCGGNGTPQELYENCKNVWQGLIDDCNR